MHLNWKIAVADAIQMALYAVLAPVFLVIYIIQLFLRYLDDSKEVNAKHVLITGATSGLGEAMALKYAKTAASLHLFGRSEAKLKETEAACKNVNRKCNVKTYAVDITDSKKFVSMIEKCATEEKIDLVIAAAGIIRSTSNTPEDPMAYMDECIDVNVKGVMNTILPFVPKMKEEGKGQLCVIVGALGNGTFGSDPIYEGSKNCGSCDAGGHDGPASPQRREPNYRFSRLSAHEDDERKEDLHDAGAELHGGPHFRGTAAKGLVHLRPVSAVPADGTRSHHSRAGVRIGEGVACSEQE